MKSYAIYNKNYEVRKQSSSGGVFYELAREVIGKNGVVFGAKFDDEWNVIHGYTESIETINDFLGSKYVQSSVGNCYKDVKKFLESGKQCLFSGTPCQVAGLKAFLGKKYENLLTIDFICHGVPSRSVWREYVEKIRNGSEIKSINFRDKSIGWMQFSLTVHDKDGEIYTNAFNSDLYMKGFLQDIYLRPSCYNCVFKGTDRKSDITLADYWGVHLDLPEMCDDKGTSFIMVHTKSGQELYNTIEERFVSKEIKQEKPLSHNPAALVSAKLSKKRRVFFESDTINFELLEKLTRQSKFKNILICIFSKGRTKIKKLLGWDEK